MRCSPKAKTRRLLCVLFLRLGPVSVGPGQTAVTARRFPPPWSIAEYNDACFIVSDHNGQALAYVYFEEEPGRRAAANLLNQGRGQVDRGEYAGLSRAEWYRRRMNATTK